MNPDLKPLIDQWRADPGGGFADASERTGYSAAMHTCADDLESWLAARPLSSPLEEPGKPLCTTCGMPEDFPMAYHIRTGSEDFGHAQGIAHVFTAGEPPPHPLRDEIRRLQAEQAQLQQEKEMLRSELMTLRRERNALQLSNDRLSPSSRCDACAALARGTRWSGSPPKCPRHRQQHVRMR